MALVRKQPCSEGGCLASPTRRGWNVAVVFFSSRRRHTRFDCDWSSDVCSSDLGLIQAVGSDDEIRELTGRRTRVIDLRGRLALPAFGDAHVHPVGGGLESLRCNLVGLRSRQQCLDTVAEYCASLSPGAWVTGGGWTMSAFPGGLPTAADLDTVTGGRPAFLPNRDHHSAWVNTAAMTMAGIDARTPDPVDGRIERDEAGRATGALHDGAMRLVSAHVPEATAAQLLTR